MENQTAKLQIQRSVDSEYRVAVYINGKYNESKTYYTSDWEDAALSLQSMFNELSAQGFNTKMAASVRADMEF